MQQDAQKKPVRTPEEARAWLARQGISQSQFARQIGVHPMTVQRVLTGECQGLYGHGHKAAVLLGIKDGVIAGEEAA
ncbi:MAG: DNA-binding protein [Pseudomonadota bacterium]|nr:DNA-binding protein [Pseudomonadota bacterium]